MCIHFTALNHISSYDVIGTNVVECCEVNSTSILISMPLAPVQKAYGYKASDKSCRRKHTNLIKGPDEMWLKFGQKGNRCNLQTSSYGNIK